MKYVLLEPVNGGIIPSQALIIFLHCFARTGKEEVISPIAVSDYAFVDEVNDLDDNRGREYISSKGAQIITPYTISFIDSENPNQFIFAAQKGQVPEGTTVCVTFPEQIIGSDGHIWKALEESPKHFAVYHSGTQKFNIEYRQSEAIVQQENNENVSKLNSWLDKAHLVTGKEEEVTVIRGSLSSITDGDWHEIYLLGENYKPEGMACGVLFDAIYSALPVETFEAKGKTYQVTRLRFSFPKEEAEEHFYGINEERFWKKGDRVKAVLAGKETGFTCVSEDYGNYSTGMDGQGQLALFLCDSIVPADFLKNETDFTAMSFGKNNNYKYSNVREFLTRESQAQTCYARLPHVLTGVNTAFLGESKAFSYEQVADRDLLSCDIGYQYMTDSLFILSLEEALEVRDSLWKFGSRVNNAETVRGPYAEGYFLRTPMYACDEDGDYVNGEMVYIVDLQQGTIYPVSCRQGNVGVRPAFALRQIE